MCFSRCNVLGKQFVCQHFYRYVHYFVWHIHLLIKSIGFDTIHIDFSPPVNSNGNRPISFALQPSVQLQSIDIVWFLFCHSCRWRRRRRLCVLSATNYLQYGRTRLNKRINTHTHITVSTDTVYTYFLKHHYSIP